ncbi:TIGR03084 family metal-binding protein [Sneathiella marina]|uniref:TIGR03084 family metal-binding protein n=1 Tax=Sneathiella marina TaxID=2950108 RepID=A0ABY4W4C6_9PROT|nr:TIGR03084 family metal-binding protein [Sneathiella marina]USG60737.1 TIGR03084 family metal-binding protein [Sneathiella marina]
MLAEAYDFKDESEALYNLIKPLSEAEYDKVTLFRDWTINDVLQHLHYFNYVADLTLSDEDAFVQTYTELKGLQEKSGSLVEATDEMLKGLKGIALRDAWHDYYHSMADRFYAADPKQRLKWVGPSMSARSSISARLMETWSHAQEIYDLLGTERQNEDRIKSIAVMGINTFGWTFKNREEPIPENVPHVRLKAPSGAIWEWNDNNSADLIEGDAAEFCQVVTQTRNIADTSLKVTGEIATRWMAVAQCFAGPARTPPAAGTRHA